MDQNKFQIKMENYTTMSIASLGAPTMPNGGKKERVALKIDRPTNNISDISGAAPCINAYQYTNKPQFLQSDVDGSRPKVLSHARNTPDLTLSLDDIPGTRFAIKDRFLQSKRHVNPLVPEYDLPAHVETAAPEQPFIRDAMDVSDIEGTKPKIPKVYKMRDTFNVNDIEGTKPGWKASSYKQRPIQPRDLNYVEDICKRTHRYIDRTSRVSDTLDPEYNINSTVISDDKKYSKPKPAKKVIFDSHFLKTEDIEGATPGWRNRIRNSNEVRNINFTLDIEGAQADTIPKGIKTERVVCPLNPFYKALDDGEPLKPLNAPLIPADMIKPNLSNSIPPLPPKINTNANHERVSSSNTAMTANNSNSVSYAHKIESENQDVDRLLGKNNQNGFMLDFSQLSGYELPNISSIQFQNHENFSSNINKDDSKDTIKPPAIPSGRKVNAQFSNPVVLTSNVEFSLGADGRRPTGKSQAGVIQKVHIPSSPMVSARSAANTPRNVGVDAGTAGRSIVTPREKRAAQQLQAEIDAVRQLKI